MHRAASQSVLEVYDGCGHLTFESCAEQLAPRLVRFLSGNGPAPGETVEVAMP
jgi:hypothetical protein